jgi:hypothetical protein
MITDREFHPRSEEETIELKIEREYSRFFEDDPTQQVVHFKDAVSGSSMVFEKTSACIIEQDPMCAQGLETLKRLSADKLDITFLFGHHGSPQHFYELFDHSEVATVLERSTYIAVEANASTNGEAILLEPRGTGRGSFQQTQVEWLDTNNKLALPCDIDTPEDPATSGGTLRQTMGEIWRLRADIQSSPLPHPEQQRLLAMNTLYYHLIREEMMLGQLGYWIHELELRGALNNKGRTSVPFMLGSFHQPVREKAALYLGVLPDAYDTKQPTKRASLFTQISHQGYASYEQLNTFAQL